MKKISQLFFIISYLTCSFAQEQELSKYAIFDLMKNVSMSFFQQDVENPIELFEEHIQKYKNLIDEEDDEIISRYGAISLIKTFAELGMFEQAKHNYYEYQEIIINRCYFYMDCYVYLSDLAKLVDSIPSELIKLERKVSDDLYESVAGLPTLLRNNLLFRSATLFAQAKLNHLTGIHLPQNQGKKVFISTAKNAIFTSIFKRLHRFTTFLDEIDHLEQQFLAEFKRMFIRDSQLNNENELTEGDLKFLSQFALDMSSDYAQLSQATRSMKLYHQKLRYKYPIDWFKHFKHQILSNKINHLDALTMLASFAKIEAALPTRRKWLELSSIVNKKLGFEENSEVLTAIETLVNYNEEKIFDLLHAQGFQDNFMYLKDSNLAYQLVAKEQQLYEYLPEFHSLLYSLNSIALRQANLADYIETVDQRNISDQQKDKVNRLIDLATTEWITLACYTNTLQYNQLPYFYDDYSLKVKLDEKRKYPYRKICSKSLSQYKSQETKTIKNAVAKQVLRKRVWKELGPKMAIIGIDVISIASLVISAGATAIITAPIKKIIKRQALKYLAKKSYQRVAKRIIAHLTLQMSSAITGSIFFTATQRVLLSAITFGKIPLYERNKTFMQNYGKELVFGGFVFFFLPYASALGQILKTKTFTSVNLSYFPGFQKLLGTSAPLAVENVFFTSIPYAERAIQIARGKEDGKLFRGYGELAHHSAFSLAVSLAFRVKYRNLLSRKK